MPEDDKIRLPTSVDQDTEDTVNRLLDKLRHHAVRNAIRDAYYDGKNFSQLFRSSVVPIQYQNIKMVLGWSAKAVDLLASRCNLATFVWPDGDIDSLGLQTLLRDNDFRSETNQGISSLLVHSVAYLVNTQGLEDELQPEPPALLHYKDARNAIGTWNVRLRRLDNLLTVNGRDTDGKPNIITLYEYNRTRTFVKGSKQWAQEDDLTHNYGMPADALPYLPRLNRPFGQSRISRAVMSMQNAALRTVIRMEGHMDVYSFPEFWMLGADASIFKNSDGTLKPEWKVMLGRIKGIPDDDDAEVPRADVKQFPASDPEPHLKALQQQAQFFSGETSIPLTSLGVSDMSNPTSPDSYVASREDLIGLAEQTADNISNRINRRIQVGLAMLNGEDSVPPEYESIHAVWRNPMHLSRAAEADAGAKTIGAVPGLATTRVGLSRLGLSDDEIQEVQADMRRQAGRGVLDALKSALPNPLQPSQQPPQPPQPDQGGAPGAGGNGA